MRTGLAVLIVSCLVILVAAQEQAPQPGQIFRSGSRTVAVYVTVSDEQGGLIPNLTQDDFEVYDDGKKQKITLFESGVQPITLVMMLDRSGSMVGNFGLVRSAAEQFVGQLLPRDKARIGSFANRIQVDPRDFTGSARSSQDPADRTAGAGDRRRSGMPGVGITSLLRRKAARRSRLHRWRPYRPWEAITSAIETRRKE